MTIKDIGINTFFIGILLERSSICSISGNGIFMCHDVIMLVSSSNNRISENNITANEGDGIKLYYSSNNNVIHRNSITVNKYDGITLSGSLNNTIYKNNVVNSGLGILLVRSSGNCIYHNNFVTNTVQAHTYMGSVNVWDNGYSSGGNYWSDHKCAEFNGSGIGEIPYPIDENNIDHYPLMCPYKLGDVNHDAKVNIIDMHIIVKSFGMQKRRRALELPR